MADQPTNQPTDHELASLEEAAARLGITVNAVRQRMKRGTLTGRKTAGGWLVEWRPTTTMVGDHAPTDRPTTPVGRRPTTTDHAASEAVGALREILAEERAALADERAKVERLVEAAAVWQVRAIQAEERLKQLSAGEDARSQPTGVEPNAPPRPPGEVTSGPETNEPHRESIVVSVWRRLFGGG